ncbi:MAG: alpha/beta fold hydrolase [Acidimicrobiales bacterium]
MSGSAPVGNEPTFPWFSLPTTTPMDLLAMFQPLMAMASRFVRRQVFVAGQPATYGEAGEGPAVVVLPAWGLSFRAYQRALGPLVDAGYRVLVPSLPAKGCDVGDSDPHGLSAHAAWVGAFLDEVGLHEPVVVVGHSLGAAVAVQLAHDLPDRVGYLALTDTVCTSMGTPEPLRGRLRSSRPLVSWATEGWRQLLPFPEALFALQAAAGDLMVSIGMGGMGGLRSAEVARGGDLRAAVTELTARRTPMLWLHEDEGALIPERSLHTLALVMGTPGHTRAGELCWLLADPAVEPLLTDRQTALAGPGLAAAGEDCWGAGSIAAALHALGADLAVRDGLAATLLASASPVWLLSNPAENLAMDLALCDPPLASQEVRVAARTVVDSPLVRLTVVAEDRAGLLADSAAVVSAAGFSISAATACTWPEHNLALHTLLIGPEDALTPQRWQTLRPRLRNLGRGTVAAPEFKPIGLATVRVNGAARNAPGTGRDHGPPPETVVELSAPDCEGLMWAACRWFADHGISIVSATVATQHGMATDAFIVQGTCDAGALSAHLSPPRH